MKKIIILFILCFFSILSYSQQDSLLVSSTNIKKANIVFAKYESLKIEKDLLLKYIDNLKRINEEQIKVNELKIIELYEKLNYQIMLNKKLNRDIKIVKKKHRTQMFYVSSIATLIGVIAIIK